MRTDPPRPSHPSEETNPGDRDSTNEALRREVEGLRRRVAELEVPARRFNALFGRSTMSLEVNDPQGRPLEINRAFEELWNVRLEQIAGYNALEDAQLIALGMQPDLQRGFGGEPVSLPLFRYDPKETDVIQGGRVRWVSTTLCPVLGEDGEVLEVLVAHIDIGELKKAEEELRARKEALEAEVEARTRELEEKLGLIQAQQEAIHELSTPVILLWDGVLALPLIGLIDSARAMQIMESLLQAIVAQRASQVIIDVTGVPLIDTAVAANLIRTIKAAQLLGARCTLVGISPLMAQMLVQLEIGFDRTMTCATLKEGLREALSQMRQQIAPA